MTMIIYGLLIAIIITIILIVKIISITIKKIIFNIVCPLILSEIFVNISQCIS